MNPCPRLLLAAGLLMLARLAAAAAPLNDPTRPPGGLAATPGAAAPAAPVTATLATGRLAPPPARSVATVAAPAQPRLQALIHPRPGPARALIDGQALREGEAWRQWRVERIAADGVLLRARGSAGSATGIASGSPAGTLWLPLLSTGTPTPAPTTAPDTAPGALPKPPAPATPPTLPLAGIGLHKEP